MKLHDRGGALNPAADTLSLRQSDAGGSRIKRDRAVARLDRLGGGPPGCRILNGNVPDPAASEPSLDGGYLRS